MVADNLREKLVKIGARIVSHGRYVVFQLAEVAVPRALFAEILRRIDRLRPRPSSHDHVALDTGIGTGEVCPESVGQQPRRLGWHICRGRDAAWGVRHHRFHAAMTCYGGSRSAQWPLWNRYLGNPGLSDLHAQQSAMSWRSERTE